MFPIRFGTPQEYTDHKNKEEIHSSSAVATAKGGVEKYIRESGAVEGLKKAISTRKKTLSYLDVYVSLSYNSLARANKGRTGGTE